MISPKILLSRTLARLDALFGRGLVLSMGAVLAICVALSVAAYLFLNTAAPRAAPSSATPRSTRRFSPAKAWC
jgi:hypothetical protein